MNIVLNKLVGGFLSIYKYEKERHPKVYKNPFCPVIQIFFVVYISTNP